MDELEEFQIPEDIVEKLRDPEVMRLYIEEGKTFQEIVGYASGTMDKFYAAAYRLFGAARYKKAADAFIFLTTLNPYEYRYWLGLGMSEQMIEEYESALIAYAMAVMIDADNPIPHYHSACCYNLLGDQTSAKRSLEVAIEQADDLPEYIQIKQDAQTLLQRLTR